MRMGTIPTLSPYDCATVKRLSPPIGAVGGSGLFAWVGPFLVSWNEPPHNADERRWRIPASSGTPSIDDLRQRERILFLAPLMIGRGRLTIRTGLRPVELNPRRNMEGATEHDRLP